jgi:hypothetical protein
MKNTPDTVGERIKTVRAQQSLRRRRLSLMLLAGSDTVPFKKLERNEPFENGGYNPNEDWNQQRGEKTTQGFGLPGPS